MLYVYYKTMKLDNTIKALAYIIPVFVLLFILYMNFLPFGYSKTIVLDVGSSSDGSGEFYVGSGFGPRQILDGVTFRTLNGSGELIFSPLAVLHSAELEIELVGEGVYFPVMPDVSSIDWDYDFFSMLDEFEVVGRYAEYNYITSFPSTNYDLNNHFGFEFDFVSEVEGSLSEGSISIYNFASRFYVEVDSGSEIITQSFTLNNFSIGSEHSFLIAYDGSYHVYFNKEKVLSFEGESPLDDFEFLKPVKVYSGFNEVKAKAVLDENGCIVFDGDTRMILPNSKDNFQDGPFAVYLEFIPKETTISRPIIDHFNWIIWQEPKRLRFQVGRMNVSNEPYLLHFNLDKNYFDVKKELLAIYNPSNDGDGYIELFIDGLSIGKTSINNEFLRQDYNTNLGISNSNHGVVKDMGFLGSICEAKFNFGDHNAIKSDNLKMSYESPGDQKILVEGNGSLKQVKLRVR
jgi:hypothetical protein